MLKRIALISLPFLLTACAGMDNSEAESAQVEMKQEMMKEVSAETLQHHNWELTMIDGEKVVTPELFDVPRLEIGEKMTANGNAGCNNFFGQGELKDGKFRIEQMGMTMKMCPEDVMNTEMALSKALAEWSTVELTKDGLTLTNDVHTLTFVLKDWVN